MKIEIPRNYIDEGLVTEKPHPTEPYLIYNYTPECQYGRFWDEYTLMCRGLILHKDTGEVIARPFKKFFNYEEHIGRGDVLPTEIPKVYGKFDGSLGILYWTEKGEPMIATRGSFISEQAQWATNFINKPDIRAWVDELDKSYTHLFEIIYPENRIVVNYGWSTLIHLASVHIETGKSIGPESRFPMASALPFTSYEDLKGRNVANEEGYILHFEEADMRVKIKFEDYVKLHKVITGLSERGIWEMLLEGKEKNSVIASVPDEMYGWVAEVVDNLTKGFDAIYQVARNATNKALKHDNRKEQAAIITQTPYPGVSFAMLDNKDYKPIIWKMLKPVGAKTFRVDIDA